MKSDFLIAVTQLAAEKRLPREVILEAVETALVSAYKKENIAVNQNVYANIDPNTGEFNIVAEMSVVEEVTDPQVQIALSDATKLKKGVKLEDVLAVSVALPKGAGRIAAQTAKQVVLQRLKEAERDAIYEEYATKQEDIVIGIIQRKDPNRNIYLELGRTEALLPPSEQVPNERYRIGQRLRVYVLEVARTARGPQVIVSRTHRNLLKCLFELEVPETLNGTVEIRSIARESGERSKVAVAAMQPGIDAVGSCVGQRGIRIQNIVNELGGEKIDVVPWDPDPSVFIANALSPAHVLLVDVDQVHKSACVVVPDRQLSLAIGKVGQNARLAARLTGWKIDIKSASAADENKVKRDVTREEPVVASVAPEVRPIETEPEKELVETPAPVIEKPPDEVEPVSLEAHEQVQPKPLRFAEDILAPQRLGKDDARGKKAKKKGGLRREKDEGIKPKKGRQIQPDDFLATEEEGE